MTQLEILTQYKQLLIDIQDSLLIYNNNLRNELFEIEPNEDQNNAYKRGKRIFNQYDDSLKNLTDILEKEKEIIEFFTKCKENKQKLIQQNNSIIDKLLILKKNSLSKQEYKNYREEWNKKRIETPDEKTRRECQEMIEELTEKQREIEEMRQNMNNEINNQLRQQLETASSQFVRQNVHDQLKQEVDSKVSRNEHYQ